MKLAKIALSAILSATALAAAGEASAQGRLNLYCSVQEDWCQLMQTEFEKATGVKVAMTRKSSGETYAQIKAEKDNPRGDIWWGGTGDPHLQAAEESLTAGYESPRMKEMQDWSVQQWKTGRQRTVGIYAGALGFGFNTELLAKKNLPEPKCWADLVKPEYKGEVQVANPHSSGTSYTMVASLVQILGENGAFDYLRKLNTDVMARAGELFITLPPQPLEIVRVPEYSQDSSPGGYYNPPALDGSRPGRFYINQKNTADNPRWQLPTLLYHEAAPGHHFQLSASQLIEDVPLLRRISPFTAYAEGWGLYAERIAAEDMKLYANDPWGDLGRLNDERFRAVRLVVDTGMHAKRWSREEAVAYMLANTSNSEDDVVREIERYVVWPGQACAYKTGQLAIIRLRQKAEKALGERFDLRAFHEVVLMNGAMPLGILEKVVDEWIASR